MRVMLLVKQAYRELFRLVHPRASGTGRLEQSWSGRGSGQHLGIFRPVRASFCFVQPGPDGHGCGRVDRLAAVVACIGNVGPGLGEVGPVGLITPPIPLAGKWVLTFCMLLGRLEIYTVLVLCIPEFWRK